MRTTDEKKTHTVIMRVGEGLYGELTRGSERDGMNLSDYTRKILTDHFCNTQKREKKEQVIQMGMNEREWKELEHMCVLSGFTVKRFMEYIKEMFKDGRIYVDGLSLQTKGECDLSELIRECNRRNYDPQDMIDRLVKGIQRG